MQKQNRSATSGATKVDYVMRRILFQRTSLVFFGFTPSTISLVATIFNEVAGAICVALDDSDGVTKAEEEPKAPKTRDKARVALENFIVLVVLWRSVVVNYCSC